MNAAIQSSPKKRAYAFIALAFLIALGLYAAATWVLLSDGPLLLATILNLLSIGTLLVASQEFLSMPSHTHRIIKDHKNVCESKHPPGAPCTCRQAYPEDS